MINLKKKIFFQLIFLISLFALISAYFIEYILGYQPWGGIDVETYVIKFEKDKANGMVPVNKQSNLRHLEIMKEVIFLLIDY